MNKDVLLKFLRLSCNLQNLTVHEDVHLSFFGLFMCVTESNKMTVVEERKNMSIQ